MQFLQLLSLAFLAAPACAAAAAEPAVAVDRLVSRDVPLSKRGLPKYGNNKGGWNEKGSYNISFYHINDVHAHLDEFRSTGASCVDVAKGCVGGYARVKTVIDKTRKTHKNSLFLNAGDEFQGTLYYTVYKGEKIATTLNQLGFDAMTLGNHEFDDGDDLLAEFIDDLKFPVISSNIHTTNKKLARQLLPYKLYPQHQLAIVAVTTETTAGISSPGAGTTFEDPVAAAQRTVNAIKKKHKNIKRIVALTHIGYEKDIELAQKTKGIHLIIGGHSHTLLGDMAGAAGKYPTIETNKDGDEVFIVTSHRWGEYLGYIDVQYNRQGKIVGYTGAPFHLTNTTAENPKLKKQVKTWAEKFTEYSGKILGTTATTLVQSTCQTQECTLGDFSADSMADFRNGTAAGAIINAGGIRQEIDAGNISLQQALETFPFGNSIVELTFTGEELWKVFEGMFSRVSEFNGLAVTSGPQISKGLRVSYNPANPVGGRLITLEIQGKPVVLTETYTIITVDFLAGGGDNFWPARSDFTMLDTMDEVWADYVTATSPIDYKLDGRISTTTETVPQRG